MVLWLFSYVALGHTFDDFSLPMRAFGVLINDAMK
jgi:hypothetical protein